MFTTWMTAALAAPALDEVRWRHRLIVLVAADPAHTSVTTSLARLEPRQADALERKIQVVELFGERVTGLSDRADALRARWSIAPAIPFEVLLVGLDGTVKARSTEPLDVDAWFARIDAMPMRLEELAGRDGGAPSD